MPMTDKYAELAAQLDHEECYALLQGYLGLTGVLRKSAQAIMELQARVQELEELLGRTCAESRKSCDLFLARTAPDELEG